MSYSPEMVALLQQLRARIFAEFGLKIRLVDPELLATLGELGRKSRDPFTRKTVVKIMALANIAYQIDETKISPAHRPEAPSVTGGAQDAYLTMTYRGNRIERRERASSPDGEAPKTTENKVVKQIYRGQVIYK